VSEATFTPGTPAKAETSPVVVAPAVSPTPVKSQDTIMGMVDGSPAAKRTAEVRRDPNAALTGVFEDIDLDIPAFIREHKSKQS